MANTTNFNWETPDDTDLVKDGAAAIRTLGSSIDTSFVDLKGGTTGQNLRKASNTDLDFTFAGDATNTVVDAAGDLLYGTAADTLGRLAIGTAGQVLKVNSGATAPEWGAAGGASFSGVLASKSGNQSLANVTQTILTFETEANGYDTDGYHSTVTNTGRITIPSGKDGYFWVWGLCVFAANGTGRRALSIFKNGVELYGVEQTPSATASADCGVQVGKAFAAVATDYFELRAYQSSGGSLNAYGNGAYDTQFGAYFLGA